jgi:nucleotide-binding universal stress UspA family protein
VTGPILFCYDGSTGSQAALKAAGELIIRPSNGYVITIWEPAYVRLAAAGAFVAAIPNEGEIDEDESAAAKVAAEEGARLAKEHGYDLVPLSESAQGSTAHTILSVAGRVGATLIVCGQRGRGPIRAALLGSVSHALSSHAHIPVLITPEPKKASATPGVSATSESV